MPLNWIALNSIKGIGPVRIKKLLEKYGSPEAVFRESPSTIAKEGIIPESCISEFNNPALFKEAEEQIKLAQKIDARIITLADKNYPVYLKEIFAPPPVLYVKGNPSSFTNHAVAVVGTRTPTPYGKSVAASITRELVGCNLTIVSGLALGIDSAAHEACLENGGFTIAVLGCGVDRIYPSVNKTLAEKICSSGALVSEFPLGIPPESFNFPRRNRIISGLSAGVIVVEAGLKSGSLITANYALQQGREVFAVPGPITSTYSIGTFNLIKDGATPARSGKEIAESLKVITSPQIVNFTSCPSPTPPLYLLSQSEIDIFELISSTPVRLDDIAEKSKLSSGELYSILLNLELRGLIYQTGGMQYIRA